MLFGGDVINGHVTFWFPVCSKLGLGLGARRIITGEGGGTILGRVYGDHVQCRR